MTESTINTHTVFDDESAMPEFPEVAYELVDELPAEASVAALGFASLLWELLTVDQKAQLSTWDRAALERLAELSDEVGLEIVGEKLRTN